MDQSFESFNTNNYDLIIYSRSFKGLEYHSIKFYHYLDKNNDNYSVLNTLNDEKITRITNFSILHNIKKSNIYYYCKEYPAKNNELYPIRNE